MLLHNGALPQGSALRLSKIPHGAFRQVFAVCCAHNLSAVANKFHTCSLISIFAQVHAPVENGFDFIRRYSGELCEVLF